MFLIYYLDQIENIDGKPLGSSKTDITPAEEGSTIDGKEVISKINNVVSRIGTFKASFTMKMNKGTEASSTKGRVIFKNPNKSNIKGIISSGVGGELRSIE